MCSSDENFENFETYESKCPAIFTIQRRYVSAFGKNNIVVCFDLFTSATAAA